VEKLLKNCKFETLYLLLGRKKKLSVKEKSEGSILTEKLIIYLISGINASLLLNLKSLTIYAA